MKIAGRDYIWLWRMLVKQSYLVALLLLLIAFALLYTQRPGFFIPGLFNDNLRDYLPLMILAVGQTIVIIGGGIDLSIGSIMALVNVVVVQVLVTGTGPTQILLALALGLLVGMLAGLLNGICVAYFRLQPIIATFATSFIFSGLALRILPKEGTGGKFPDAVRAVITEDWLGISSTLWISLIILGLWFLFRMTRLSRYLYAIGGQEMSAYMTGVPVNRVRVGMYMFAGIMAALAAFALLLSTGGSGSPRYGLELTLPAVVAVVLGGTRLRGGQGGIAGSLLGAVIWYIIGSLIFAFEVPSDFQDFARGLVVMLVLAGPGLIGLIRRRSDEKS